MIRPARHERILSELARRGAVSVDELATALGVSEATVRRDLRALEQTGLLRRTYGGAALADQGDELPYHFKVTAFLPEKRRIGAAAAAMIQPGQVIGCTGGTTVAQVIRALKGRPVTIVTNSVTVATELAASSDTEVIVTGGALRNRSYELVGPIAQRAIQDFYLDVALIGVDGLSLEHGLTTYNHLEAYVNRAFIERARETWVVADHSKLGRVTPAVIAPLERLRCLITDTDAPSDLVGELEARGIRVILA